MKSLITSLLILMTFQVYPQSKDDFKLIKKYYNKCVFYVSDEESDEEFEKLTIKHPNNPIIKLFQISRNPLDISIDIVKNDFNDSLIRVRKKIIDIKKRNNEINRIKILLDQRKDSYFEKGSESYSYEYFTDVIDEVYIDKDELIRIFKSIENQLRKKKKFLNTESSGSGFISKLYGREVYSEIKKREFNKIVDKFWSEFWKEWKPDNIYRNDDVFTGFSYFINEKFRHSQMVKDGKRTDKFKYSGGFRNIIEEDESTIEETINEILQLLRPDGSDFYFNQYNKIKTYEVVNILKSAGYDSPYLDLLNLDYKLHVLFELNYTPDIGYIFENVFNYSHQYEWIINSQNRWLYYELEEPYSEKDISTMELIEKYFEDNPEFSQVSGRKYFNYMVKHNNELINPTPIYCQSNVHKNTIIQSQFYLNNGRKIFGAIYEFEIKEISECQFMSLVTYTDLSGNGKEAGFRTSVSSNNKIKLEMYNESSNSWGSPVYIDPVIN